MPVVLTQNGKTYGGLSKREIAVLRLLCDGLTYKEVGTQLGISNKTVESHREHIVLKVGLSSTALLTRWAIREKRIKA